MTVVCAETDEQAQWLSGSNRLAFVRLRSGRPGRFPSPEEAAAYQYSPMEDEIARSWTGSHVVGSPERVRKELLELADRTGADELMITSMVHDHAGPAALLRARGRRDGPAAARLTAPGSFVAAAVRRRAERAPIVRAKRVGAEEAPLADRPK